MERCLYLLPFLALLVVQTTAQSNSNMPECRRCTRNAECNNQNKCVCKSTYVGDPLFHCYHPTACFCRMCNDPGIQVFSGERVVVNTIGSSRVADLTSDRLAQYEGKCYLKLSEWTVRVQGKIYIEGIQFQLAYQDKLGQSYSVEARITAKVQTPVFSMQNQQTCTQAFADIIFLMDESGSIRSGDFRLQKNFVISFIRNFELGRTKVRFAFITFGSRATLEFKLDRFSNVANIVRKIQSLTQAGGLTRTDLALRLVLDANLFSSANGGRDDASKLVIVLTDGLSTSATNTRIQADRLKATGVQVAAIGVGNADVRELRIIATSEQNVFTAPNFAALDKIKMDLINRTCNVICVGTYSWKIEVRNEGEKDFKHAQTITSQGTPSDTKFVINKFGCVIEFKRIDAMFLRVEFQCCGVKTAIRAYNPCDDKKKPGIWILVNKRNNPMFFWPFTVPLCLDEGQFTIASVENSTGLPDPRFAYSFLSLVNGGPVDYPNAPKMLLQLRFALRACVVQQLKILFNLAGFMLDTPPLIHCVSTKPGQDDITYLFLRTTEYYCQGLVQGCNEAKHIISTRCSQKVINSYIPIKTFLHTPCIS